MDKLSIADQLDLDWLTDMYCASQGMMITVVPNSLGEHIVRYGDGASKAISHECWIHWQILKAKYRKRA